MGIYVYAVWIAAVLAVLGVAASGRRVWLVSAAWDSIARMFDRVSAATYGRSVQWLRRHGVNA